MNEKRVVRNIEIPGINGKKVICDVYGVKPINLVEGLLLEIKINFLEWLHCWHLKKIFYV